MEPEKKECGQKRNRNGRGSLSIWKAIEGRREGEGEDAALYVRANKMPLESKHKHIVREKGRMLVTIDGPGVRVRDR